jgi:glycerophosphoryl diester phosphodiesterase
MTTFAVLSRAVAVLVAGAAALAALAPAAGAVPRVEAHRGGPMVDGQPRFAENSLQALRYSWNRLRVRSEIDVALTKDRVPIIMHDDTLDRTTNCRGFVGDKTIAQIRRCRIDVIGSEDVRTRRVRPTIPIPTLREVLVWAKRSGALLNVELKNNPGERDYDTSDAYSRTVAAVFRATRFPLRQYFISGFTPNNLISFRRQIPGVVVSMLTLAQVDDSGFTLGPEVGARYLAPGWPITRQYVQRAHREGFQIDTYTLQTPAQFRAAARLGVDALITDDPTLALQTLRPRRTRGVRPTEVPALDIIPLTG